jgi:hypothetical protein
MTSVRRVAFTLGISKVLPENDLQSCLGTVYKQLRQIDIVLNVLSCYIFGIAIPRRRRHDA